MLSQLPGEELVYEANDFVTSVYHQRDLDNFRAPKTLTVKQNAQVMLIKNLSPTLANGSVGKVVDFEKVDDELCPIVHFSNGEQRVIRREEWSTEHKGKVVREYI